ncbi:Uncharacterised protein [Mycobacteroides abscessus subsp. abscessus]|nr:Uncharacterised protein [Mycobacteroides abscessus subsp. abscessus]
MPAPPSARASLTIAEPIPRWRATGATTNSAIAVAFSEAASRRSATSPSFVASDWAAGRSP